MPGEIMVLLILMLSAFIAIFMEECMHIKSHTAYWVLGIISGIIAMSANIICEETVAVFFNIISNKF